MDDNYSIVELDGVVKVLGHVNLGHKGTFIFNAPSSKINYRCTIMYI